MREARYERVRKQLKSKKQAAAHLGAIENDEKIIKKPQTNVR